MPADPPTTSLSAPAGPDGRRALACAQATARGDVDRPEVLTQARRRLRAVDPRLAIKVTELAAPAAAPDGALAGVVAGVKDLIAVAGAPRRCGAPALFDATPQPRHAPAVARLVDAGATLVATLALHPIALGITGEGVGNPAAPERVPGGSSSGSAAAVAAGAVHIALGTDTGGSVRIPAACCGVAGLKPTRGRIPTDGVAPLAPSLDTVGPLAHDTAGCALALAALDPFALGLSPAEVATAPGRIHDACARLSAADPAGLRVGVPRQTWQAAIDPAVRRVWRGTLDRLDAAGGHVAEVELPALTRAPDANAAILLSEAAATHAASAARWDVALPADVASRLWQGREVADDDVDAARATAAALAAEAAACFEDVDVLCLPTLPCPSPTPGQTEVDICGGVEPVVRALTRFTNAWNLTGLPAGSVPAGVDDAGAPVGVQVVGAAHAEQQVLRGMTTVEACLGEPGGWDPHG